MFTGDNNPPCCWNMIDGPLGLCRNRPESTVHYPRGLAVKK